MATLEEITGKTTPIIETVDAWGKKAPTSNSMIAGAGAVGVGIVALNTAPSLFVTGAIIHTLYAIGTTTQSTLLKRWEKTDDEA